MIIRDRTFITLSLCFLIHGTMHHSLPKAIKNKFWLVLNQRLANCWICETCSSSFRSSFDWCCMDLLKWPYMNMMDIPIWRERTSMSIMSSTQIYINLERKKRRSWMFCNKKVRAPLCSLVKIKININWDNKGWIILIVNVW